MALLSKEEENKLAEDSQKGDSDAFNKLISSFKGPIIAYVKARVFYLQSEDEDDILQDIWMDVWEKIQRSVENGGYDTEKGKFYTWLCNYTLRFLVLRLNDKNKKNEEILFSSITTDENQSIEFADPNKLTQPEEHFDYIQELKLKQKLLSQAHMAYLKLLELVFLCGGYPHQQFGFAFSKYLYGKRSDRGIEGSPKQLHNDYGNILLKNLPLVFWKQYISMSCFEDTDSIHFKKIFKAIVIRFDFYLDDLFDKDKASRNQFQELLEKKVSQTNLMDYYTTYKKGYTVAIPDWCYKVKKRIRKALVVDDDDQVEEIIQNNPTIQFGEELSHSVCTRCKLRYFPPCLKETASK